MAKRFSVGLWGKKDLIRVEADDWDVARGELWDAELGIMLPAGEPKIAFWATHAMDDLARVGTMSVEQRGVFMKSDVQSIEEYGDSAFIESNG